LPLVTTQDEDQARRISWGRVLAWTGLGVVLLCAAGILQGAWIWTGVSIDILVHVGGTLLLAPLLPFLERSLTRRVVRANARMPT
jgi:membrane associated rhomboid family serine protease